MYTTRYTRTPSASRSGLPIGPRIREPRVRRREFVRSSSGPWVPMAIMAVFAVGLMPFLFKPDVKKTAAPEIEDPSLAAWPVEKTERTANENRRATTAVRSAQLKVAPKRFEQKAVVRTRDSATGDAELTAKPVHPSPFPSPKRKRMSEMFPSNGVSTADDFVPGAFGQWALAQDVWLIHPRKIDRVGKKWRIVFHCNEELKGKKEEYTQTLTIVSKDIRKEYRLNPEIPPEGAFVVFITKAGYFFMLTSQDYTAVLNGLSASKGSASGNNG